MERLERLSASDGSGRFFVAMNFDWVDLMALAGLVLLGAMMYLLWSWPGLLGYAGGALLALAAVVTWMRTVRS